MLELSGPVPCSRRWVTYRMVKANPPTAAVRNGWPGGRSVVALVTRTSSTSSESACRPVGERQLPSEWWKGTAVNATPGGTMDQRHRTPKGRRELTDALEDCDLNAAARNRPPPTILSGSSRILAACEPSWTASPWSTPPGAAAA